MVNNMKEREGEVVGEWGKENLDFAANVPIVGKLHGQIHRA